MGNIMKFKILFVVLVFTNLIGCGTSPFVPQEYPLRDGAISDMDVVGAVQINNMQESKAKRVVYSYIGTELISNYHDVTKALVEQSKKELDKNSEFTDSDKSKSINISVSYFESHYVIMHWRSSINFTITLGNGQVIEKEVKHGSGSLYQDLNGCITEAVMHLFNDEKVRAYLEG